ncbi:MAG: hypothetical protein MI976_00325 [Pseudomonadales bacterium]|nr:hypothetical protein [Pseudomonadales bacterium]
MAEYNVDKELLNALLDAARCTALSHRGKERELYVLGQLEATANLAYILTAGNVEYEFEAYCQRLASEAIERMEALNSAPASANRFNRFSRNA